MNAIWSDEQKRRLAAMGYTLYLSEPIKDRTGGRVALRGAVMPAQTRASTLLEALLRAAGVDPGTVADGQFWLRIHQLPSLEQLRDDPAAKRAAWIRLRAMRADASR